MLEIKKIQIKNICVDIKEGLPKEFQLRTECRVKVKTPKSQDNKTMLLDMELDIMPVDVEDLSIKVESNVMFGFEQIPEDYVKFAEKECIPAAQKKLFQKVDEILAIMGYNKLELAERMDDRQLPA